MNVRVITAGMSHRAGERVIDKATGTIATRDRDNDERMSGNRYWVNHGQPMVAQQIRKRKGGVILCFVPMGTFIMDIFLKNVKGTGDTIRNCHLNAEC